MDLHRGELLGVEHRILADDRVVGESRHIGNGPFGDGEGILPAGFPGRTDIIAAQLRRIAHQTHGNILDAVVEMRQREEHGGRIELRKRIVKIHRQMVLGVHLARQREFVGKGVLLLRFDPLLARGLGLAAIAFELLALLLLLFGFDEPPGQFQGLGDRLQDIDRIVLEIGDLALDRIGKCRRRHVEPQGDGVAPDGLRVEDDPILGDAVEADPLDLRVRGGEIEHRLVLQGTFGLRKHLAPERPVGKHAQVELRFSHDILADRIVPHGEIGLLTGVVGAFEEAYLVGTGFINLVVVLVLDGIDAVSDRLEVLGDEDTVVLGAGDDGRLVLEDRRVVFGDIFHRISGKEPDEALRHGVGLIAVGRITRHDHRVDLGPRREDITHRVERVALVVVSDGAAEVERISRIRLERVAQLDDDPPSAQRNERFLLHLRRGEELLLLILELHELVELDVDLLVVHERPVGRKVVGRHVHDDRGQRIARPTRGGHHARATAQESRNEKQQHGGTQRADDMSFADIHRYHLLVSEPSCSGSAFFSLTTRQPSST